MPDQYSRLVGYTLKYPYLVGISTDSGNFGTGIIISSRFVLTCSHVLQDSTWAEVISQESSTSARVQKVDESLDLALLELARPISAPKVKFTDSPLKSGAALLAVGVQATPGQSDALSVAEITLKYKNKNEADGKILDMQLEGGARPGYSGGPVVVEKGGAFLCVGVMRFGGHGANLTNAIGLASIRAFVEEYIPDMSVVRSGTPPERTRRLLISTAMLFGVVAAVTIAGWYYRAPHSPEVTSGAAIVATQESGKTASGRPASGKKSLPSSLGDPDPRINLKAKDSAPIEDIIPTGPASAPSAQTQERSSGPGRMVSPQTPEPSVDQGNPDVEVWVNTSSKSKVYHCPGTRWYGRTQHGEYMTQAEAQKKAYRPADWKVCE